MAKVSRDRSLAVPFEFEGTLFNLEFRKGFTPAELKSKMGGIRTKYAQSENQEDSAEMMADGLLLFMAKWDLEDDDGPIPLELEAVCNRVPTDMLGAMFMHIQDLATTGGLAKNS